LAASSRLRMPTNLATGTDYKAAGEAFCVDPPDEVHFTTAWR